MPGFLCIRKVLQAQSSFKVAVKLPTCVAAESAPEKLATHAIEKDKLSLGNTKEPSLHPVKLHLPDQPKSGLPSSLTQSFQPETPEHLQGDQDGALSTIYSGLSYSGRSSGDRAGLMGPVASNSPHLVIDDAKQASGREQNQLVSWGCQAQCILSSCTPLLPPLLLCCCHHLVNFSSFHLHCVCKCKYCLNYFTQSDNA